MAPPRPAPDLTPPPPPVLPPPVLPPPAEPAAERPVTRRSILGLGAVAGASASVAVAGGIAALTDSNPVRVVNAQGFPVITADAQSLTASQQQQAATNIGAVRTVEPEQFPGGTDDAQFAAAVDSLARTGGVIRLRPGKQYTWLNRLPDFDWSKQAGIVVTAWGATVTFGGPGTACTSMQSDTIAGTPTLTVLGGTWVAPQADAFFRIVDSGNHLFYRCRGEVPGGAFVALSNVHSFSERNHFIELEDHNCREVLRFSVDGSQHASFARTVVKDLRLQGGVSGYPKLNVITSSGDVQPAVYDSTFDGITGNIADGVIVQRLAGGMSGTRLSRFQCESPDGSRTAAYFDVGPLDGKLPVLVDGPPVLRNIILFTRQSPPTSPFASTVAASGLALGAALVHVPYEVQLDSPGPVDIPSGASNVAMVLLNADCTASVLDVIDNANPGNVQTLPTTTQTFTLVFVQGGAGGHRYAWPSNCRFAQGRAPFDSTAGTQTSVTFVFSQGLWLETARAVGVPYT